MPANHDPVPHVFKYAFHILIRARDLRKEFIRVYGRERGEVEAQNHYSMPGASRRHDAAGLIRQAYVIAKRNGWDWKAICRECVTD